jgi:hypothetical protein
LLPLQAVPAQAGLMRPVLQLLRPQVEARLASLCVGWLGGSDGALAASLEKPCRQLAAPVSRCLVEETDASGNSLAVVSDLLSGRLGDSSELVVKRCAARLLGLPPDSLREVSLREIANQFRAPSQPQVQTQSPR